MNELKKELIRLQYKNDPLFNELSEDKKELLYEKYSLTYSVMPINDMFIRKRRELINNGILDLVSKDMACCISKAFIFSIYRDLYFRSHPSTYKYSSHFDFSNFNKESIPYELIHFIHNTALYKFNDYDSLRVYQIIKKMRDRRDYRQMGTKWLTSFYKDVLPYIACYCIMDSNLLNLETFIGITDYLTDNILELYNYFENNFAVGINLSDPYPYFPHYLFEKYKEGSNKKVIL